jgi:FkbM family methyltransferase
MPILFCSFAATGGQVIVVICFIFMIWKIDLAWIAKEMCLLPCRTFCECAVGPMEISVAPGFIGQCKNMLLIEPHPRLAEVAAEQLKQPVLQVAVGLASGEGCLVDNNGSSFLLETWAPSTPSDSACYHKVPIITFDSVDDGTIDILALDCEGQEWAVLSKMSSLPFLLTIEVWDRNPYKKEIIDWLHDHKYVMRFSTGPTTETHLYSLG